MTLHQTQKNDRQKLRIVNHAHAHNIDEAAEEYRRYGFTVFPTKNKKPKHTAVRREKELLSFKGSSEIGIFLGEVKGQAWCFCVADCDDREAVRQISQEFQNMGIYDRLTVVKTPSRDGYQIWLKVASVPDWSRASYNHGYGMGEFRIKRNAHVVAPPSRIQGQEYTFVQGGLDDFIQKQPVLQWEEVEWLIPESKRGVQEIFFDQKRVDGLVDPSIRLMYDDEPRVLKIFKKLAGAKKGDSIAYTYALHRYKDVENRYPSRSEAEAAIVTGLILSGWSFEEIHARFEQEMPGHYADRYETPEHRLYYLRQTYNNATQMLERSLLRRKLTQAYNHASRSPWPGRGGGWELNALLALIASAWRGETVRPHASLRQISEYAGITSLGSIRKALIRLENSGKIKTIVRGDWAESGAYDLSPYLVSVNRIYMNHSSVVPPDSLMNVNGTDTLTSRVNAELWSRTNLSESARMVYVHLSREDGKSVSELQALTGKARNTVIRALQKLKDHSLAIDDGKERNPRWHRGERAVEDVAAELNVEAQARKRRATHKRDRERHRAFQNYMGNMNLFDGYIPQY